MENNLYYTPTIEEFHVGFEYEEYQFLERNWKIVKCEFIKPDTIIDPKWFRVKTLDQSDIESLGWKLYSQELTNRSNWCCFRNTQLEMYIQLDNNYFPRLLNFKSRGGDHIGNFKIKIKNKSELIKLMQQLNIK